MRQRAFFAICLLILTLVSAPMTTADEWQPLFNGKDLTGWHGVGGAATNWTASDGVLACNGKPGSHWLATDRQYGDFELSLEFNVPKDGNSGVFIRAPKQGNPWVKGMEIQVLDDYGEKWKNLKPAQFTGSIYAVVAPSKRATKKAGEWQTMLIRSIGRSVQVTINGQQVVDANLDNYSEQAKRVTGLSREAGHIGLQNHSSPISYRNIRLRTIASRASSDKGK
jgi:hypothetical protein